MSTLGRVISAALALQRRKLRKELEAARKRNDASHGQPWEPVYKATNRLRTLDRLIEEWRKQNE